MPSIARPYELPPELANGQLGVALLYGHSDTDACGGFMAYVSLTGDSYAPVVSSAVRCVMGRLETAMADPGAEGWYPADSVDIDIRESPSTLLGQTTEEAQAGSGGFFLVDDEICTYEAATLLGTNRYRLTGLRRAWFDTEPATHAADARIIFLPRNTPIYRLPWHIKGEIVLWKFVALNLYGVEVESLADVDPEGLLVTERGARWHYHPGQTYRAKAGEALARGELVRLASDGLLYRAIWTDDDIVGLAMYSVEPGEKVYVLKEGAFEFTPAATPGSGYGWDWLPGQLIYATADAGMLDSVALGRTVALASDVDGTIWVDCHWGPDGGGDGALPELLGYDTGTAWQFIPHGDRHAEFFCEVTAPLAPELRVYGWNVAAGAREYGTAMIAPASGAWTLIAPANRYLNLVTTNGAVNANEIVNVHGAETLAAGGWLRVYMDAHDTLGLWIDQRTTPYSTTPSASAARAWRTITGDSCFGHGLQWCWDAELDMWGGWDEEVEIGAPQSFGGYRAYVRALQSVLHDTGWPSDWAYGYYASVRDSRSLSFDPAAYISSQNVGYRAEVWTAPELTSGMSYIRSYGFYATVAPDVINYWGGTHYFEMYGFYAQVKGERNYGGGPATTRAFGLYIEMLAGNMVAGNMLAGVYVSTSVGLVPDTYTIYTSGDQVRLVSPPTIGRRLLWIDQNDVDEPFVFWDGSWAADVSRNLSTQQGDGVGTGPLRTGASLTGWRYLGMVRVEVPTYGNVWMPVYQIDV